MNLTKKQVEIIKTLVFRHIDNMVQLIDYQTVTGYDYESIHDDLSEITECNDIIQKLIAYQPHKNDEELPFK